MSGASASWHDLALYLVARYAGPSAAQTIAKFFLLQWHTDGQAPYIIFQEETDHGDAVILKAQQWMKENLDSDNPIEEVVRHSGLPERSFKRRFSKATGHSPIEYMQNLRVEAAKQQLESGDKAVDEISYSVGYEDAAFFRRLFKRTTGLTPGAYRKKFRVPLVGYEK
jgi:transcriptional regulator GlxA family with amidase domain